MLQRFPRALVGHGYPFWLIEGRFSIAKWIRPLSWAVEWIKPGEDIVVKRGDPWFDLQYFANDLDSTFMLRKSDLDDSFRKSLRSSQNISGSLGLDPPFLETQSAETLRNSQISV